MGFLSNLFKRKPGGTVIGNLIRGVANQASGGVLGNGQMMISQQDADKRDLTDAQYEYKYGQTKAGVPVQTNNNVNNNSGGGAGNNGGGTEPPKERFADKVRAFFKKPLVRLLFAITIVGLLILLFIKLARKGKNKRRY